MFALIDKEFVYIPYIICEDSGRSAHYWRF